LIRKIDDIVGQVRLGLARFLAEFEGLDGLFRMILGFEDFLLFDTILELEENVMLLCDFNLTLPNLTCLKHTYLLEGNLKFDYCQALEPTWQKVLLDL